MIASVLGTIAVPAIAVGCALCQFGFEQWAQSQTSFFVAHGTMTNVLFGLFVMLAVGLKAMRGDLRLRSYSTLSWTVMGLFLYALLSVFWSVSVPDSLGAWGNEGPYIILFVLLCPLAISSKRDVNVMLMTMLTLGAVTTCLVLALSSFQGREIILQGLTFEGGLQQAGGNPLATASLAGWVCLTGLLMNFQATARFWKLTRWGVVMISLILTFRSGSRGQLLGLLAAGVLFLPLSRRIKSIPGFIGAVVGVAALLGLASVAFDTFADAKRWNLDHMVSEYQGSRLDTAWFMIQAWLSGGMLRWFIGLGNSAAFAPFLLGVYPHFVPAEVLSEEGLFGFAIYVMIFVLAIRAYRRAYAIVWNDPAERGRLAVLGSLCLFEFILSMKQGSFIGNTGFPAFIIILGRYEAAITSEHAAAAELFDPMHDPNHDWDPAAFEGTGVAT